MIDRRRFIRQGAASLAAAGILPHLPQSVLAAARGIGMPIGYQSYVLRKELNDDFAGVLAKTAAMGYEHVEMCSPKGYSPHAFSKLTKYSGKELRKIIEDSGLKCWSSHFTWNELMGNLDERIAFAQEMGLQHMVASAGLNGGMDDLKRKCEALNKVGEKVKSAGMIAGYHNHNGEFEAKKDGVPDYDIILQHLDPNLVKMQFQVAAIQVGFKAADYFRKHPARFISAHLQDYSKDDMKKQVVLGRGGVVDWKDFFKAAKTGGLKWVYVEMESDPGTLEGSVDYLKKL
jgi:sugar phosphate isomerase/epimerase